MRVNIENLNNAKNKLNSCCTKLKQTERALKIATNVIPNLDEEYNNFKKIILDECIKCEKLEENIKEQYDDLSKCINDFITSENNNIVQATALKVSSEIKKGLSNIKNALETTAVDNINQDNKGANLSSSSITNATQNIVNTSSITDNENPEIKTQPEDSQVTAVIRILYGKNAVIKDEEKQRIANAIKSINDTEVLKDLDSYISNIIIAQIVKDYIDKKLELDGIKKEDLEKYIKSQPSIQIYLKIDEVIKLLKDLIEKKVITKKQIELIIKNNVNIHSSDKEFMELYEKNGGKEKDISKIKYFYDKKTKTIHMKKDATSVEITYAIISEMDELIKIDPKTKKPMYYKTYIKNERRKALVKELATKLKNEKAEVKKISLNYDKINKSELDAAIKKVVEKIKKERKHVIIGFKEETKQIKTPDMDITLQKNNENNN